MKFIAFVKLVIIFWVEIFWWIRITNSNLRRDNSKNKIGKLGNSEISVKAKRRLLSTPPVGHGTFSAIASIVLPSLISLSFQNKK